MKVKTRKTDSEEYKLEFEGDEADAIAFVILEQCIEILERTGGAYYLTKPVRAVLLDLCKTEHDRLLAKWEVTE